MHIPLLIWKGIFDRFWSLLDNLIKSIPTKSRMNSSVIEFVLLLNFSATYLYFKSLFQLSSVNISVFYWEFTEKEIVWKFCSLFTVNLRKPTSMEETVKCTTCTSTADQNFSIRRYNLFLMKYIPSLWKLFSQKHSLSFFLVRTMMWSAETHIYLKRRCKRRENILWIGAEIDNF